MRTLGPDSDGVIGVFIKTAAPQIVEILGLTGLDFGVLDAEHAPLNRQDIDVLILAGRAVGLPLLVRTPGHDAIFIQSALDSGAAGVLVPHVDTSGQAAMVVSLARYRKGLRGFSSATRSAGYGGGAPMAQALDEGDRSLVICQIETPEAVENAAAIAATPGVGGLLVGRADLAVAMNEAGANAPAVVAAANAVLKVARAAGKLAGVAVGKAADVASFRSKGANLFVISSDQGLLRQAMDETVRAAADQGEGA